MKAGGSVVVVGAGFTGLLTSYYLVELGYKVEIYEKSQRSGGLLQTFNEPLGLVEGAANGLIWNPDLQQICDKLGLEILPTKKESRNRYIFRGRPRRWPLQFFETIGFLVNLGRAYFTRRLAPIRNQSIADWALRSLGPAAFKYLVAPGLSGIYAGRPEVLSSYLILGRFFKNEKKTYRHRGSVSFRGGMSAFTEALSSYLESRGVSIHYGTPYLGSGNGPIFFCGSLKNCQKMFNIPPLKNLEMLPVVTVTQFFRRRKSLRGFGVLFPEDQKFTSLGVLFNSDIFEGRSQMDSETWILGGALNTHVLNLTDAQILSLISIDRGRLVGYREEPEGTKITRWPEALPHYSLELETALESLPNYVPPNVVLHGNYLGQIGLGQILKFVKGSCEQWHQKNQQQ